MSIMRCEQHDLSYDSDFIESCPQCADEGRCPVCATVMEEHLDEIDDAGKELISMVCPACGEVC